MVVQSSQCLCGNAIDDYGDQDPSGEAACNDNCPGQSTTKCGGNQAITVYAVYEGCFTFTNSTYFYKI